MLSWNDILQRESFWWPYLDLLEPDDVVKRHEDEFPRMEFAFHGEYRLIVDRTMAGIYLIHPVRSTSAPAELRCKDSSVWLGELWGHGFWPMFRWQELELIKRYQQAHWTDQFDFVYFPALMSFFGSAEEDRHCDEIITELRATKAINEESLNWYSNHIRGDPVRWEKHTRFGWCCDSETSFRGWPNSEDDPESYALNLFVDEFFDELRRKKKSVGDYST